MKRICASFSGDYYMDFPDDATREQIIKRCKKAVEKDTANRRNLEIHLIQDLDTSFYVME